MKTCTITIKNEVFSQVTGLDKKTLKQCVDKLKFLLPYRFHVAAYKIGKWDGSERFFKDNGNVYSNLLPEVMPIIIGAGYGIEVEDERIVGSVEVPEIDKFIFSEQMWPKNHRMEGEPILLRDDQVEAANIFAKNRHAVQELSTGYGKTILTAAICKQVEHLGRTITIVPSKSLVKQTYEDFVTVGLDAGMFFSEAKEMTAQHTVTTWQSMDRLLKNYRKDELSTEMLDALSDGVVQVLIDECHQAKSKSLDKLMSTHFAHIPLRRGFTGTIPKEQYEANFIIGNLGEVVHKVTAKELQEQGFLASCNIKVLQQDDVDRTFDNYHQETNYLTTNLSNIEYYVDLVNAIRESGNTIILANYRETCDYLHEMIDESLLVDGSVSLEKRDEIFKSVHDSDNKVVVATYGVAAVGINIPRLYNVIMLEPGKSFVRVIQTIGRGLRLAKDKDSAIIWDLCADAKFSRKHMKTRINYYESAQYPHEVIKASQGNMIQEVETIINNNIENRDNE